MECRRTKGKFFKAKVIVTQFHICLQVVLSFLGIVVIGMSLGASLGFCFYIGLIWGEMHPSIPFLLLGIGVDDMYVIVQAFDNLSMEDKQLPLHEKVGNAMRHAGVSITVT